MNITIQGVEITLTPEQLQQIDAEVKKMNEAKKPTKEERFWELMSGLAVKVDWEKYPDSIFLFKEAKCWGEYDIKNKYLWLRYDAIWSVFYNEYSMNYDQVQSFIEDTVEKHFNCKGVTSKASVYEKRFWVEKHFNCKGVTSVKFDEIKKALVEKHFNCKGVAPNTQTDKTTS